MGPPWVVQVLLLLGSFGGAGGIITLVVRQVLASPVRESDAYQRGIADEAHRCAQDIARLQTRIVAQDVTIGNLRDGLMALLTEADLSPEQRRSIREAMGAG